MATQPSDVVVSVADGRASDGVQPQASESLQPVLDDKLRAESQILQVESPYIHLLKRGNFYPPPEAGPLKDEDPPSDGEMAGEGSTEASDSGLESLQSFLDLDKDPPKNLDLPSDVSTWYLKRASFTPAVVWHVNIFPDDYNDKRHTDASGKLKARRGVPHMKVSELLNGLTKKKEKKWVFEESINGWPALKGFTLASITYLQPGIVGVRGVKRLWDAIDDKPLPEASAVPSRARATFLAPRWTSVGWAPESPGFVWWYSAQHGNPRYIFGEGMLEVLDKDPITRDASITMVHTFAHRYPVQSATPWDIINVHTGLMVEWSHGLYTTIVELAWRNGVAGYGGKSNWCEDKLEANTVLMQCLPEGVILPWNDVRTEIRTTDLPFKNLAEFKAYLHKYSEKSGLPLAQQRFIEPEVYQSGQIGLRECSEKELAKYCLNYISRMPNYDPKWCNCQSFAADGFAFLTGTRNVKPFGTLMSTAYTQHHLSFMYPTNAYARPVGQPRLV